MRELTVMETRFYICAELDRQMYDALFNINVARMHGKIDQQTAQQAETDVRNAFSIARVALQRCETAEELEEIACQLKFYMQSYIVRHNLPFKF